MGRDATRIALVTFSNTARVEFDFNRYSSARDIENYIDGLRFFGQGTNIAAGLRSVRNIYTQTNGDRADASNLVYLFVGDRSTDRVGQIEQEADQFRMRDTLIGVVSIGFTTDVNRVDLERSAWSSSYVRMAPNIGSLNPDGIRRVSYILASGECTCCLQG